MLNKNDIKILREMFKENNHVLKEEIRDEMHSVVNAAIFASEQRMTSRIEGAIESVRKDIHTLRDDILDLVNEDILPQIEQNRQDIARLKVAVNIA